MPSVDTFDTAFEGLPLFPDDVPIAPLPRLSLHQLLNNDVDESERLWDACSKLGFFYLDLRSAKSIAIQSSATATNEHSEQSWADGDRFLQDADQLFRVSDEFFALPVDEKVKYDLSSKDSYFGYKGYGAAFVDKQGNKDRNEFYNVSKDDILGLTERLPQPELLGGYRPLLHSYICNAHSIVSLILTRLNRHLGLVDDPSPALLDIHKLQSLSGDQVTFIQAPPQPMDDRQLTLGAHTDFGSVTLLFNKLGGLQVYPPPEAKNAAGQPFNEWLYVRPLPGHCIVNLGDAMVKFTAGLLKSGTHRVVNPPGEEQGRLVRTSLVYFSRPKDDVMLKVLKGRGSAMIDQAAAAKEGRGEIDKEIKSKDWITRRALGRREVGKYKMQDADGTEVNGSEKK